MRRKIKMILPFYNPKGWIIQSPRHIYFHLILAQIVNTMSQTHSKSLPSEATESVKNWSSGDPNHHCFIKVKTAAACDITGKCFIFSTSVAWRTPRFSRNSLANQASSCIFKQTEIKHHTTVAYSSYRWKTHPIVIRVLGCRKVDLTICYLSCENHFKLNAFSS